MNDFGDPTQNPENYKWGIYYNPEDDRIVVPKRTRSLGFTLNFARKEAYFLILLLLVVSFVTFNYHSI